MTWTIGRTPFELDLREGRPQVRDVNGRPLGHHFTGHELRELLADGGFQLVGLSREDAGTFGEFVGMGAQRVLVGLCRAVQEPPSLWRRLWGATTT